MRLDHVIYGVRDLDEAAALLNREHGLGFLRVHVFPDSVTTVTFRGMNPVLVP